MEIFKLFGSIFVNTDEAETSISKTEEKAQGLGNTLSNGIKTAAKWGAAIVAGAAVAAAAVVKVASSTAATADRIDKMSQKIGISRQAFQELDFICSQSGTSVETLQMGIKTLTNQMQAAADGTESASQIFKKLGISIYDNNGKLKDQEAMMWEAMEALQGMKNQTEKAAIANDLFGRSGTELMPLLNGATGSIEAMKEQAHELGLVLSDELVDNGVELTDSLDQTKRAFQAIATNLGASFMPIVTKVSDYIQKAVPYIQKAVQALSPVITGCLDAIITPLMTLSDIVLPPIIELMDVISNWMNNNKATMEVIGSVILGIVAALGLLKAALGISSLIQGVTTAITGMNAAMAANPIGLVVVAIAGLVAALAALGVVIYENWDAIVAWCDDLGSKVKTTFTNIGNTISSTASNIKDNLTNKFNEAKNNVANHLEQMQQNFTSGLERMRAGAGNILNNIGNSFSNTFSKAKNTVQKAIDKIKKLFDFEWKLPDIKLPHFNIQPSGWKFGDLLKGKIPTLDIEWYAKGGVMTQPTAFGYNNATNSLMVGGEAGAEAIAPISTLQKYVSDAVAANNSIIAEAIDEAIMRMINFLQANQNSNNMQVVLDSGVLVGEIAPAMDKQLGNMVNKRNRGN